MVISKWQFPLECFDNGGAKLWTKPVEPNGSYHMVALRPDTNIIIAYQGNDIRCFNARDGDEIWSKKAKGVSRIVASSEGSIVALGGARTLVVIGRSGSKRFSFNVEEPYDCVLSSDGSAIGVLAGIQMHETKSGLFGARRNHDFYLFDMHTGAMRMLPVKMK